jgi:hypothetical protein
MKYLVILSIFAFSTNVFAATKHHTCVHGDFVINVTTEEEKDVSVMVYKNSNKVAICTMKVTDYNDGKKTRSVAEIIEFEKIGCSTLGDKSASAISIIDKGYVKMFPRETSSSVYLINNVQPLECNLGSRTRIIE